MVITLACERQYVSPYVFAVFVALTEKKLPFERVVLDSSRGDTKEEAYLADTITGRVPSLRHDDFAMAESSAIVEYLEEAFPTPAVLPKTLLHRARARQLMSWLRSDDTAPIREERPSTTIFYEPATTPLSPRAAAAAEKLVAVAQRLGVGAAPNLFGEWSVVDAELAFMLHRLLKSGDPLPAPVKAWASTQWARPSVQAYCALERPPRG